MTAPGPAPGPAPRARWRVDYAQLFGGVLLATLILSPICLLLGATFQGAVTVLSWLFFALPALLGVALLRPARSRSVGIGILVGVALFWIVLIPLCAGVLGG